MQNIYSLVSTEKVNLEDITISDLKKQACLDLTLRARGGIFIYLSIWLITSYWVEIYDENTTFFYLNTLIISAISVMRIIHYVLIMVVGLNTDKMYNILILLIVLGGGHWGVTSAWIVFGSSFQELHYPYLIILSAFAIGGSIVLSISPRVRIFYPFIIFFPSFISGLFIGGEENYLLAILLMFSLFYILDASKISRNDYWNALYSCREVARKAKQLEKLSVTDQLTGLNNRMYLSRRFSDEWKRSCRVNSPISMMLIDLDYFKVINDTYGHLAGDECLKEVSKVLKSEIKRDTDVVARYGGEEFILLLPDTNIDSSIIIAQRLVFNIARIKLTWEGKTINVSCSIGLASTIPSQHVDSQSLIKAADNAMYQAKEQGRNQYCISTPITCSSSDLIDPVTDSV